MLPIRCRHSLPYYSGSGRRCGGFAAGVFLRRVEREEEEEEEESEPSQPTTRRGQSRERTFDECCVFRRGERGTREGREALAVPDDELPPRRCIPASPSQATSMATVECDFRPKREAPPALGDEELPRDSRAPREGERRRGEEEDATSPLGWPRGFLRWSSSSSLLLMLLLSNPPAPTATSRGPRARAALGRRCCRGEGNDDDDDDIGSRFWNSV